MTYEYKAIPEILERKEILPKGANLATQVTVHRCFCGQGTVEYHCVPGFDDWWFELHCDACKAKYSPVIDRCGSQWKVYLNQ